MLIAAVLPRTPCLYDSELLKSNIYHKVERITLQNTLESFLKHARMCDEIYDHSLHPLKPFLRSYGRRNISILLVDDKLAPASWRLTELHSHTVLSAERIGVEKNRKSASGTPHLSIIASTIEAMHTLQGVAQLLRQVSTGCQRLWDRRVYICCHRTSAPSLQRSNLPGHPKRKTITGKRGGF